MDQIVIQILSREPHISQILTGFCTRSTDCRENLLFEDHTQNADLPYPSAMVRVIYHGKILIYDVLDGYQHPDAIRYHLEHCDYYFKRSFSPEKNLQLGSPYIHRMHPLGFNYHVSCKNHPTDKPAWKETIKRYLGIEYNNFCSTAFTSHSFESLPQYKSDNFHVIFATRLWSESDSLSAELNEERQYINQMRIDIIRQLRKLPGIHFIGGLSGSPLAEQLAPDLILPPEIVPRKKYLQLMRSSDICIGSMGLHESIGWKTGEYVAAGKAIVNETFHYSVPGNFAAGTNYLPFSSCRQCMDCVQELLASPKKLHEMKQANRLYYTQYLRPDVLIRNTLDIADSKSQFPLL